MTTVIRLLLVAASAAGCTFNVEAVSQHKQATWEEGGWTTLRAAVDGLEGGLEVRGVEGTGVRADVEVAGLVPEGGSTDVIEGVDLGFAASNGILAVRLGYSGEGSELFHFERLSLEVPHAAGLELATEGTAVEVRQMSGKVVVSTRGGRIRASTTGEAEIRSVGGVVELAIGSGSVEAGSGAVRATVLRDVRVSTGGGEVELRFPRPALGPVEVRTEAGQVRLHFPADAGVDLDYRTDSGGLEVSLGTTVERVGEWDGRALEVNGGGVKVVVRTGSGSLALGAL